MVGRATFAACSWIVDRYPGIQRFYLESNFATDKKASQINIMRTRGKRVTAEAVVNRDVLIQQLRVEPESLAYHAGVANIERSCPAPTTTACTPPTLSRRCSSPRARMRPTSLSRRRGSSAPEPTREGDLYISLTLPSLIVATYGGGTGLATQRESLEMLGCYGLGKVQKFAEIVAGVALGGRGFAGGRHLLARLGLVASPFSKSSRTFCQIPSASPATRQSACLDISSVIKVA